MDKKYKVIISNKNMYYELELNPSEEEVKFGTEAGCHSRLHRDLFFEEFTISFVNLGNTWKIICPDNLYIYVGDVRKLTNKLLEDGESFAIKYQSSGANVFQMEFVLDFYNDQRLYMRAIDIRNFTSVKIGAHNDNQIILGSQYVQNDFVFLQKKNNGYELTIGNTQYGIYLNGTKITEKVQVNDTDFFSIADYIFYYKNGFLWTEIRNDMRLKNVSYYDSIEVKQYPRFYRNTREKIIINKDKIVILDPPPQPKKTKNHIFITLLPSLGMIAASGIMASVGNGMGMYSMITGGIAIVMAIVTMIQTGLDYKKELRERSKVYKEYEEKKRMEIEEARVKERNELLKKYPDFHFEKLMLSNFSSDLFDRTPKDEDFLDVRLGKGNIESVRALEFKKQECLQIEDDLQLIPEQLAEEYKIVKDVPVVCHLREANAIGIIGKEKYRFAMMKNMVFDLCLRQYSSDVMMIFVAKPEHADIVTSFRFLPHVNHDSIGFRCIVCDDDSKNRVFDQLYKTLSQREKDEEYEHILVFFYDEYGFRTHPVTKFLYNAKDYKTTFIFMASQKGEIPLGCTYHIYLDLDYSGILVDTSDSLKKESFSYEEISNESMMKLVEVLAPVYTEEISLESSLTKNITLFELLGILSEDDLDLKKRWEHSVVYQSMAAPIGVKSNEIIYLDLHDKAHGPHGLVAGTTGSGKSELLQTYILSIATLYHPYEVGFVIIDFKGGGMANQFEKLPHLMGTITNIDGKEIDRSLRFIKAELEKRQHLFAEAKVNHIDKYIKKYKNQEVSMPLPHLILIVDEFAELKAEQPDFMQELISAARIGRSLGVHLILATQKPSGQVDDQIWSNSRFKVCLKVQDQADSNEVLKSPLAAEIKEPGRAYLQVGNNEIFELFQSAYSGAPDRLADSTTKEFTIYEVSKSGRKNVVFSKKRDKSMDSNRTQLEAVVSYVSHYFSESGQEKLSGICLPPLSSLLHYEPTMFANNLVDIGIFDDPGHQKQASVCMDFNNKNTLIIGSSQFGKTNLLMSIIRTIASVKSPKESIFYILDFGSMVLKNFERLHHVGGVVCPNEDEKLKNLMKLLFEEISKRKEKMLEVGVGSFSAYKEAGYKDVPQIHIVIDNFAAAMELYFQDDDGLLTLLREGITVGISFVIASTQTSGINYRYMSCFSNRIAFYCNDHSEYLNMFDQNVIPPNELPGRCILKMDKRVLECQTYLAFAGEKEIERIEKMREIIDVLNKKYIGICAKTIPYIPATLSKEALVTENNWVIKDYKIPIGLRYSDVKPLCFDLKKLGLFGLCFNERKSNIHFISYLFDVLQKNKEQYPVEAVIFDDVTRELSHLEKNDIVCNYTLNIHEIEAVLEEIHGTLQKRFENLLEAGSISHDTELLLLVIHNNDVASVIDKNYNLSEKFEEIVTKFRNLNIMIIFSNVKNNMLSYDAPLPLLKIKEWRQLLLFDDLENLKVFDVPYEELKNNRKRIREDDAYYIQDNYFEKVKMVTTNE